MKTWLTFLAAGLLAVPMWAKTTAPGMPGALNYIEGQASVSGQPVDTKSVGSVTLQSGDTLATQDGRAEILLTPGVFLRVDKNSAVRMDSPGLANTELTLQQGRAMVEVDDIQKENNIVIREDSANTRLTKKGLYEFNADSNQVLVFDGKAEVMVGDRKVDVGGGHMLTIGDPKMKSHGFDKNAYEDDFYRWAKLRSSYLAQANVDAAKLYVAGGPGWYGPGWYWDPWFASYTWIPGAGVLWSPFGWGFYSPFAIYSAPVIVGGHVGPVFHGGFRGGVIGPRAGAIHGPVGGGFHGGGFHGGRR